MSDTYNGNHGNRAKNEEYDENRQSDADICDYECLVAYEHADGQHDAHSSNQAEENRHRDSVLHDTICAQQRANVEQLWVHVIQCVGHVTRGGG